MRTTHPFFLLAALCASISCKEAAEDEDDGSDASSECGDPDGDGGDTGDVPNVLGAWTVTFGSNIYDANACSAPGLTVDDLAEPLGGAMEIGGRIPDQLVATFSGYDAEYDGLESVLGGIVFTGITQKAGHTLYAKLAVMCTSSPVWTGMRSAASGTSAWTSMARTVPSTAGSRGDWKATKSGN